MRVAMGLVILGLALTFFSLYGSVEGIGWFGILSFIFGVMLAMILALSGELHERRMLGGRGQA